MQAVKPLLSVSGQGVPPIRVTAEHPFYTRSATNAWNNERRAYRRTLGEPTWTPAADLRTTGAPMNAAGGDLSFWASPAVFPALPVPEVPGRGMVLDERLMWLAGRYVGEGWTRLGGGRAELVITCDRRDADALRERLSAWPRAGQRAGTDELAWHERETSTAYQFSTSHQGLVIWLRQQFGHGEAEKAFPAWALGMPERMRAALLAGYVSANGSEPKIREVVLTHITTVSRRLAFSTKALVESLGTPAKIYGPRQSTSVIAGRRVNARPFYSVRWRHEPARRQHERDDLHFWTRLQDVADARETAPVFNISVEEDESYVADGIVVHNCKHFSKAKGGKPVKRNVRDLAWTVVLWAKRARPRVIILENVEEFRDWGPLVERAPGVFTPCPDRRGETFARWTGELKRLGYKVEWRELRACDYGAPTIRKRLFVIARRDGRRIVWPKPTHGAPDSDGVRSGKLKPWRTAAEIIDWSIPCPSIFDTAEEIRAKFGIRAIRPLADATMRRIARGVVRYVLTCGHPFIVPVTHHGDLRSHGVTEPVRTQTTANRGEHALIMPHLTKFQTGSTGAPMDGPVPTVTANSYVKRPGGAAPLGLVAATMVQTGYGEREGQAPRSLDIQEPLGTQVAGGAKHAVVAAFLAQHNTGVVGHDAREPVSTLTTGGSYGASQQSVVAAHLMNMRGSTRRDGEANDPLWTQTAGGQHSALISAFLSKYYGQGEGAAIDGPMHTDTTKDRFGLVTVEIDGATYAIADIGMRMLTPRERFRAQGFPDDYQIDVGRDADGNPVRLTATAQGRMCGNSVCPPLAAALVNANCADLAVGMTEEAAA
ncbi:DNA cytosine methyltransferase [Acuticoccus sediminis]